MNSSFRLFTIRGIDLKIHITFPLILLWAAYQYGVQFDDFVTGGLFGIIVITLLFMVVTLHELGHSFAAQHYGVPVKRIVLLPIGGVAQLERMPSKPIQEFVIAIAGPAVNVFLAVLLAAVAFVLQIPLADGFLHTELTFQSIFAYIFIYNIILAVFNLLPAFPMDGGRVLRALMAMKMDYVRATAIAVNVGRAVAVVLAIFGLLNGGLFMVLIALFVFAGGTQELGMVRYGRKLAEQGLMMNDQTIILPQEHTVQEVYAPQVAVLGPHDTLDRAMDVQLVGWQADFPVAENQKYIGFVTEAGLNHAFQQYGESVLVYAAMSPAVKPVILQTDLRTVLQRMDAVRVNALPVVEYGRLLGMITRKQIEDIAHKLTPHPSNHNPRIAAI